MFKLIAILLMLLDHVAWIFADVWGQEIYYIARSIGRLSFPLFCYALARGYNRTSNFLNYFLRITIMAIGTQVVFETAFYIFDFPQYRFYNVLITFSLSLVVLAGMDLIENSSRDMMINLRPLSSEGEVTKHFSPGGIRIPRWSGQVLGMIFILLALFLTRFIQPDYNFYGIATIVLFQRIDQNEIQYEKTLRKDLKKRRWTKYVLAFLLLNVLNVLPAYKDLNHYGTWIQMWSVLAVFLFPLYEKEAKPSQAKRIFFYLFYPVHFVLLLWIKYILKI